MSVAGHEPAIYHVLERRNVTVDPALLIQYGYDPQNPPDPQDDEGPKMLYANITCTIVLFPATPADSLPQIKVYFVVPYRPLHHRRRRTPMDKALEGQEAVLR